MVVAHQGGWDEAAFTPVPIVVLGALLWLAKRRAERADHRHAEANGEETE